jgi:hypothetical protein
MQLVCHHCGSYRGKIVTIPLMKTKSLMTLPYPLLLHSLQRLHTKNTALHVATGEQDAAGLPSSYQQLPFPSQSEHLSFR